LKNGKTPYWDERDLSIKFKGFEKLIQWIIKSL